MADCCVGVGLMGQACRRRPCLPVGCCTNASTSRHLLPLVHCHPPRRHLLVLFLFHRLVVASMPPFSSPPPPPPLSWQRPGISAVVGIVPAIVVVDDNNNKEYDGIIVSGISIIVGIVASRHRGRCRHRCSRALFDCCVFFCRCRHPSSNRLPFCHISVATADFKG